MNTVDVQASASRGQAGVRAIAIVNAVAAVLTAAFWALVYVRLFGAGPVNDPVLRTSSAATLGFLVGDLVWALPLLAFSVRGLWRRTQAGWLLAQMVNALWFYSMTVIWVRDLYAGTVSPGAVLFTPFALFAAWAAAHLWQVRDTFFTRRRPDSSVRPE